MDASRFLTFCATFFMISLSPGLCMTLSMSLGVSVGVRRALWMMLGELVGVALVGAAALGGVAALLLSAPQAFMVAKVIGAAYLIWSAVKAWRSPVKIALSQASDEVSTKGLTGFIFARLILLCRFDDSASD